MDRIAEFRSLLSASARESLKKEPDERYSFYKALYGAFIDICNRASLINSYKAALLLDEELNILRKKSESVLSSIQIDGAADIKAHFEGIKYIMGNLAIETVKKVESTKHKLIGNAINLEPEKPKNFKRHENKPNKKHSSLDYTMENNTPNPEKHVFKENYQALEQENRRIVETSQYEATKQRLLKIEAVQRAINENLILQDERIDNVCISNDITSKTFKDINSEGLSGNGSFIRRILFVTIICLTVVLLFLHIYYR